MKRISNYINDEYTIRKSDGIIDQKIGSETIILNTKSENYLGLDEPGTIFWEILLSTSSIKQAHDQILCEYNVSPKKLKEDLTEFIHKLLDHDLAVIIKTR